MKWFGEPWPSADLRAPICEDDSLRMATPVGENCLYCGEPIGSDDRGYLMQCVRMINGEPVASIEHAHAECQLRSTTGNHLHLRGMCTHVGSCNDMSNLTYRQEARVVWAMLVDQNVAQ